MAALPQPVSETARQVEAWWAARPERLSRRLGASQIGHPCERRLWFAFRWSFREAFSGRMRRLFDRGHREEAVFVAELRGIGVEVHDRDPSTGEQFEFTGCGGHFVAKIDGVGLGIPEAPKTWHNLSFKTANDKAFAKLAKDGVAKAKSEHVDQVQAEMALAGLERTLYVAVNKNDDTLHAERIRRDAARGEALLAKAERVIRAPEPPPGISADPAWFECKFCPAREVCHGAAIAPVSCRTCLHSTPEMDSNGRWSCAKWGSDIPVEAQQAGCPAHRYIPALLSKLGEAVDADAAAGWVEYRAKDGRLFRNGDPETTPGAFKSSELALGASVLTFAADPVVAALRAQGATILSAEVEK